MYTPEAFRQTDPGAIARLMAGHPLATLITQTDAGMEATPIPLMYVPSEHGLGRLVGHVAKGNSVWKTQRAGSGALAIFQGPQHYISPNWYQSKHEDGRAVPTWNYAAVHVHGRLAVHHDPAWLLNAVAHLTEKAEAAQPRPWKVSDAPADFITGLLSAIVGIELHITSLEAKWKVSQNRSVEDRVSVANALEAAGGTEMAALVRDTV